MSEQRKNTTTDDAKILKQKKMEEKTLRKQLQHGMTQCVVCMKEIPISVAHTTEGPDYVAYFCGIECYHKWTSRDDEAPDVD